MMKKLNLIKLSKIEVEKKEMDSIRAGNMYCMCMCQIYPHNVFWHNEAEAYDYYYPSGGGGYDC
jgi:natural product precursor